MNEKYKGYLRSEKWDIKRKAALKRDNYICQGCLKKDLPLDVHHLTYDRIGDELMCDLISLCRVCHDKIHGKKEKDIYYIEPNENEEIVKYDDGYDNDGYLLRYNGKGGSYYDSKRVMDNIFYQFNIGSFFAYEYKYILYLSPSAYNVVSNIKGLIERISDIDRAYVVEMELPNEK